MFPFDGKINYRTGPGNINYRIKIKNMRKKNRGKQNYKTTTLRQKL